MKNNCYSIPFLALLALSIPVLRAEPQAIDINGGFEQADPDQGLYRWSGEQILMTNEVHRTGSNALALPFSNNPPEGTSAERYIDPVSFNPGDELEVNMSILLKSGLDQGECVTGEIWFCDPEWERKEGTKFVAESDAGNWQNFTQTLIVPEDFNEKWHVKIALIAFRAAQGDETKEAYFDDISVSKITP